MSTAETYNAVLKHIYIFPNRYSDKFLLFILTIYLIAYFGISTSFNQTETDIFDQIISVDNAELVWTIRLPWESTGNPLILGRYIIFNTLKASIAVDKQKGTILWSFVPRKYIESTPISDNSHTTIYITTHDRVIYKIDIFSGMVVARFSAIGEISATPLIFEDNIYFGDWNGYFYALNKNLDELWSFSGNYPFKASASSDISGRIIAPSYNGKIFCFNHKNGNILWITDLRTREKLVYPPITISNKIIILTKSGTIYILDKFSGTILFKYKLDYFTKSNIIPSSTENFIYYISLNGTVYKINTESYSISPIDNLRLNISYSNRIKSIENKDIIIVLDNSGKSYIYEIEEQYLHEYLYQQTTLPPQLSSTSALIPVSYTTWRFYKRQSDSIHREKMPEKKTDLSEISSLKEKKPEKPINTTATADSNNSKIDNNIIINKEIKKNIIYPSEKNNHTHNQETLQKNNKTMEKAILKSKPEIKKLVGKEKSYKRNKEKKDILEITPPSLSYNKDSYNKNYNKKNIIKSQNKKTYPSSSKETTTRQHKKSIFSEEENSSQKYRSDVIIFGISVFTLIVISLSAIEFATYRYKK